MSHDGGYHGSPHTGKRNTRTKYSSILHSGVVHAPIAEHGAVLSHHYPVEGGYYGRPHTGQYNTRTKYSSILHSGVVHAPIAEHGAVLSHGHLSHHYPVEGGYYGRPHTGNYNSRTKWTSIVHGSVPRHFVSAAAAASAPAAAIATASPQPSRSPSAPQSAGKPKVDQAQIDAVQKQYGGAYTCIVQVVKARTSDVDQNYFQDEYDCEGLGIDEAAVRKMLQSLPAPLNLQSIQNKGKSELKFVVQNGATKLTSDFIITYKGGDIDICSAD